MAYIVTAPAQATAIEPGRLHKTRIRFVLVQLVHLALFGLYLDGGFRPDVLTASGGLCLAVYLYLLKGELLYAPVSPTPFLFYLAASLFRLGIGAAYLASLYTDGYWWLLTVGVFDVTDYLLYGHFLSMLGDLCFILGYYAVATRHASRIDRWQVGTIPTVRVYIAAVLFCLVGLLLRQLEARVAFGGFGQLAGYLINYGPSAAIYILLHRLRSDGISLVAPRALVVWLLFALNIAWSIQSYMNTDLFIALLPIMLIAAEVGIAQIRKRGLIALARPLITLLILIYFFLFVVSAYSQLRRPEFWSSNSYSEPLSQSEVAVIPYLEQALWSAIPGTAEHQELHEYPRSGAWGLVSRMTMTMFPAWAYMQVHSVGPRAESLFEHILVAVTPRFFWPEKPQLSPGADFQVIIGLARFHSEVRSATALTMQGAYFWWGGYPYLLVGCFVTGAAFAYAFRLFGGHGHANPVSATILLALYYNGFHWFESAFLGAIPFYIYLLVVFWPLQKMVQYWLDRPARSRARTSLPHGAAAE